MTEHLRERPQDREVSGTLEIEHPALLFGLIVLFEPDLLK